MQTKIWIFIQCIKQLTLEKVFPIKGFLGSMLCCEIFQQMDIMVIVSAIWDDTVSRKYKL